MDMKNKILNSKRARGTIIAGFLTVILVYLYVVRESWIFKPYWYIVSSIATAIAFTAGAVIKAAFDIKESWKLGLGVVLIGALFVALFVGTEVLILFVPVLIIFGLLYLHQKRFPKKKPK